MPWRMRRGCGGLPRAEAGSFATEPGEHEARAVILARTASTWRGSSGGSRQRASRPRSRRALSSLLGTGRAMTVDS
jgi:hypothetical protein